MTTPADLASRAAEHLRRLCLEIPNRCVGGPGNRAATDFFAATAASFSFAVETPEFDCLGWSQAGASLEAAGALFEAWVSPYSPGCQVSAPLTVASTLEELQALQAAGSVLLLRGDLAREQILPKNFPFLSLPEHQRLIQLLEAARPAAIIAATGRDPNMAGAVYPFPLIEDGDFDIPSIYLTDVDGLRLAGLRGRTVQLSIRAERRPARGCNVVARKGAGRGRRVVLFAHIDAKDGTPGALDNAAGVVSLLLLAELLAGGEPAPAVELVALNGEDFYSNPGEKLYLQHNQGRFEEIGLGVNLDGLGDPHGPTAYSLYGCPPALADSIRGAFAGRPEFMEGEAWFQGDHMLFVMNQRPALALTSARAPELLRTIIHTAQDRPENVDPGRLAEAALALRELTRRLEASGS